MTAIERAKEALEKAKEDAKPKTPLALELVSDELKEWRATNPFASPRRISVSITVFFALYEAARRNDIPSSILSRYNTGTIRAYGIEVYWEPNKPDDFVEIT